MSHVFELLDVVALVVVAVVALALFAQVDELLPLQKVFEYTQDAYWVSCHLKRAADKVTEDGFAVDIEDQIAVVVVGNENHWFELGIVVEVGKVDHEGVIRAEEKVECGQQD